MYQAMTENFCKDVCLLVEKTGIVQQMIRRGLVFIDDKGEYNISAKGYEILGKPSALEDLPAFIEAYRNLFPKTVRSGGYLVKGSKSGCVRKMRKFIETHPEYTREMILTATQNYILRKQRENWQYMSLSHNFIEKDGTSQLEAECENLIAGIDTSDDFTKDA